MEDFQKKISAAQGYSELGMHDDAVSELDAVESGDAGRMEVLETRLLVLMHAKRWKDALAVSRKICRADPEAASGFIHTAFCLHEMGRTGDAKNILLEGPPALLKEPTYHYNLACYEAKLGNFAEAHAHLEASFSLDKKFREFARADPDLEPIRHMM